jgi:mono/diheme cytochrome c family protein
MLKPLLLLSAVTICGLALIAAPAVSGQAAPTAASKKATAEGVAKAKKLYAIDCALCHGDTGDGKTDLAKDMQLTMIDWSDPKSLADHPDQELFNTIRHGKGKMPAEEAGRAKDDEVMSLIAYIRSMAKDQASAPPAAPAAAATASTTPPPNH